MAKQRRIKEYTTALDTNGTTEGGLVASSMKWHNGKLRTQI